MKLKNDIAAGGIVTWADVDASMETVRFRREMETTFGRAWGI